VVKRAEKERPPVVETEGLDSESLVCGAPAAPGTSSRYLLGETVVDSPASPPVESSSLGVGDVEGGASFEAPDEEEGVLVIETNSKTPVERTKALVGELAIGNTQ